MADGFVQVPPDSTGKQVDAASLDVGLNTVMRQRMIIADNSATSQYATVTGGALVCTGTFNISAMPSVNVNGGVAISGTAIIAGVVGLTAGTAVIGDINAISRTVQVAISTPFTINNISATVNVAGTFTISTIDNISATVTVAGTISLAAGTANIGTINNISAAVAVTGTVSLGAGTAVIGDLNAISRTVQVAIATPFTVNNISAVVAVSGTVSLGAGTAVIGDLNAISRTVQVAIGTPFTLQGISTTVIVAVSTPFIIQGISTTVSVVNGAGTANMGGVSLVAGTANIGFINNISATVTVAGNVNISTMPAVVVSGAVSITAAVNVSAMPAVTGLIGLTAGAANIGFINNISATVIVATVGSAYMSASRGPKSVVVSTSAGVALIAAPGAGQCVYITQIVATNGSATLTRAEVFQVSATASAIARMYMAASGGGFVLTYNPPIKCLSNVGVTARVDPSVSKAVFNVHFFVAAK